MEVRLSGRTAVVTGGASGLGRAIALRFADEGAFVVVGDIRRDPREGGAATEELLGDRGAFLEADASRWTDLDRLVTVAVDYGPRGVLVNAVAPGKILTGSPEQQDPDTLAYSQSRTPFHRLGRPDDVAGAALFLASDDSGYVSGVNLLVDGGWMAY